VMLDGVASDLDVDELLRRTTYSITVTPLDVDAVEAEERTREVLAWARLSCVVDDLAPGRYRVTVDSLNLDSELRDTHRVIDFNVSEEVVVGAQTPEVVVPVALETSVKCIVRMEVPFPDRDVTQYLTIRALALDRSPLTSVGVHSCSMGSPSEEHRPWKRQLETHLPPGRWALFASVRTEPHHDRDGTHPDLQGYVGRIEIAVESGVPLEVFVPLELASSIVAPTGLLPAGNPGRTELGALPVDMPPSMAELWQWTRAKDGTCQVMGLMPSTEYRVPGTELVLVSGPAGTTVTLER